MTKNKRSHGRGTKSLSKSLFHSIVFGKEIIMKKIKRSHGRGTKSLSKSLFNSIVFGKEIIMKKIKMKKRFGLNRQKSRGILENVLSGTKAGFKTLLALIMGASVFMAGQVWAAEMVKDPTTGKMVTAPEYGGTITWANSYNPRTSDSWFSHGTHPTSGVVERLAIADWGVDRSVFNLKSMFVPFSYMKGALAESWEMPDDTTIIFHIRKGVHWHDKPPMNGRELTADDVVYNWHRLLGLGKFSEAGPTPAHRFVARFESVTATDDWTVVFKLEKPSLLGLNDIILNSRGSINAPEVIEEHGDVKDWRNLVGTGPFMLTDWVKDISLTWTKNPDYWGFDEKYPENRLPYVDETISLIMKEEATRIAALRTGKVDALDNNGSTQITSIDAAERLKETNPELVFWDFSIRSETSGAFNTTKPPFDDIRVRHAMQMALDNETMNNTYYKGYADWIPQGLVGPGLTDYFVPFEEWPEEVKQYYIYDPEGAEALLDEAGYPRGADGIRFKTTFEVWEGRDLGGFELQAAYWSAIGVEVEVMPLEGATHVANIHNHTYEGLVGGEMGFDYAEPLGILKTLLYTDSQWNRPGISIPELEAMIDAAGATLDIEEKIRLSKEINMYALENHWYWWGPRVPNFNVHQPWIIGYNGEYDMGVNQRFTNIYARLWIDSALKKEMGH